MIYYVEDDDNIRGLTLYALKQQGIEAEGFSCDSEFKAAVARRVPDAVLLDIMLPDTDGLEIMRRLRADSETATVPIMMLTAKDTELDKVVALDGGADDYLTKPADMQELVLRVKALLRRANVFDEKRITVGATVLDETDYSVTRGHVREELPPKEFQLLFKLLANPGRTFTRAQLLDDVWGWDTDSAESTVNVHINRLRTRFANWGDFEIQTVRGLGYRAVVNESE